MTITELQTLITPLLRYPTSMLESDVLDASVNLALNDINAWTGGCVIRGDYETLKAQGAKIIRAYPSGFSGLPDYRNSLPFEESVEPNMATGSFAVGIVPYTLENIDTSLFAKGYFVQLVACYTNIALANKVYLTDAMNDSPFNMKGEEVINDMNTKIQEIQEKVMENKVVPSS